MKLKACILSAGMSKRMGVPKALVKYRGKTFLEIITENLKKAGIEDICVVVSDPKIKEIQKHLSVLWLLNDEPEKGPLLSFKLCIERSMDCDGALLYPVDHPFVRSETISILMDNAREDGIAIPVYKGKRGHPSIFGKMFFEEILDAPLHIGARYVIRKHPDKIIEVNVDDPGILLNINTKEDLLKARSVLFEN